LGFFAVVALIVLGMAGSRKWLREKDFDEKWFGIINEED